MPFAEVITGRHGEDASTIVADWDTERNEAVNSTCAIYAAEVDDNASCGSDGTSAGDYNASSVPVGGGSGAGDDHGGSDDDGNGNTSPVSSGAADGNVSSGDRDDSSRGGDDITDSNGGSARSGRCNDEGWGHDFNDENTEDSTANEPVTEPAPENTVGMLIWRKLEKIWHT